MTSGPSLFCLCKPFSCKACPGTKTYYGRVRTAQRTAERRSGMGTEHEKTSAERSAQRLTVPCTLQGIEHIHFERFSWGPNKRNSIYWCRNKPAWDIRLIRMGRKTKPFFMLVTSKPGCSCHCKPFSYKTCPARFGVLRRYAFFEDRWFRRS